MKYENGDPVIAILPIAANLDHRLTLVQYRVLVAIFSYRNRDTSVATVKRETLSIRCGYSVHKISSATTDLERLGWLKKIGKGGKSKACEYVVTVPDLGTVTDSGTVPESGTVPKFETVPDLDAKRYPNQVPQTVPESGTRIKELNRVVEQSKNRTDVRAREAVGSKSPETLPLPSCIDAKTWHAFCEHRRQIKQALTPIAAETILADLAEWHQQGLDAREAIKASIRNGWKNVFKPKPDPVQVAPSVSRQARRVYQ